MGDTNEKIKDENIFTRYNIYRMLIKTSKNYRGSYEYYDLERYLSVIYDCDCTDCGGPDISRQCNVEKAFMNRYGIIRKANMV
tara:strand:- start:1490 stop:1738 length:249 start_codon:yes stop_codon:yes gene_type:complete